MIERVRRPVETPLRQRDGAGRLFNTLLESERAAGYAGLYEARCSSCGAEAGAIPLRFRRILSAVAHGRLAGSRLALLCAFKPAGLRPAEAALALLSGFHRDLFPPWLS